MALIVLWWAARKKKPVPSTDDIADSVASPHSSRNASPVESFTGNTEVQPVQVIDDFTGERSNIAQGNLEAEVRMLIDYGNKREAIRVLREKLGLDLKDAADLADRLEQGATLPAANSDPAHDADHDVRDLVANGHLIEAIKLVRERKGLDLKAAKAYIERL